MSVKLIPEEDLRAALAPYQKNTTDFEAEILAKIKDGEKQCEHEELEAHTSLEKVAAVFLPLPVVTGGKVVGGGANLSSLAFGQKLIGFAALPAISLFVMIGAAFFSARKIRSIQQENHPEIHDAIQMQKAVHKWHISYKWITWPVFAFILFMPMIGGTWLLFLFLVVSFGILLCLLSSFTKLGVANRLIIGQSCMMGLMLLGQVMASPLVGRSNIHFVDQKLISVLFWLGTLALMTIVIRNNIRIGILEPTFHRGGVKITWAQMLGIFLFTDAMGVWVIFLLNTVPLPVISSYVWSLLVVVMLLQVVMLICLYVNRNRKTNELRFAAGLQLMNGLIFFCILAPLLAWFTNQIWRPVTPARIQHYVESFETGPYPSIYWENWEIPASWAIETGLEPDLSRARKLLEQDKTDKLFVYILGRAFRMGLVQTDQIGKFAMCTNRVDSTELEAIRRILIPKKAYGLVHPILSLDQKSWAIYALEQSNQLSSEDRDFLEQRLLTTIDKDSTSMKVLLKTALRVTQLLEVIDRPVDRNKYRKQMHQLLSEFHCVNPPLSQNGGGFGIYDNSSSSLVATSHAIELMQIYGVPEDLDLHWVRSYLSPRSFYPLTDYKMISAVTLDRLNRLPGAAQPTWLEILYYERSLFAAMVLVLLCLYATLSSPPPMIKLPSNDDNKQNKIS